MFNKDLEELNNKQRWTYNNWNEKYTRRNQHQNNWDRRMDKWAGRQNGGNHCHETEENRMKRNEDSLRDQH